MNNNTHASPEQRLPGEVVERYIQPDPREVVERYVRPLPGRRGAPARPFRRGRGRTGLWVFLLCLGVTLTLAVGTWAWNTAGEVRRDRFSFDYEERESSADTEAVTIPTYPYGEGVTLTVAPAGGEELTAQEIYRLVNPSVVTVLAQLETGCPWAPRHLYAGRLHPYQLPCGLRRPGRLRHAGQRPQL
jgi:serine protease Do